MSVRLTLITLMAALLAGCSSASPEHVIGRADSRRNDDLGFQFVREADGGDRVQVQNLVPVGASPEDYGRRRKTP